MREHSANSLHWARRGQHVKEVGCLASKHEILKPAKRRHRQRTASRPALAALPMATVATGTPLGICEGGVGRVGIAVWNMMAGGACCAGPQHLIASGKTGLDHPALAPKRPKSPARC